MPVLYPSEIEIWRCWFLGREGNRIPSEQGENQQQTQPTYGTRPESNPDRIGGKRALSPLRPPRSLKSSKALALLPYNHVRAMLLLLHSVICFFLEYV